MTAPAAISRIDDGVALPGDALIAEVLDRHSSVYWYRLDRQVDAWQADRCVICGKPGEGLECDTCTAGHDHAVARSADL